ncbi:DUF6629 family protein [Streptacidiphilus sp. N1-10]|uniref:DUF6629 family protein n=1 Tax=Streptacidiphilus jeojiensis TaxID=3229225 RepID=A0ABV6XQ00_9ACTN
MCWSSTADLVAGGAVTAVGVVTLASVRRGRDALLAALPLVLGLHQLIESVVWRGAEGEVGAGTAAVARTAWAVIAYPLLPLLVPVGVLLAVRAAVSPARRRLLLALVLLGLVVSVVLAVAVARHGVSAQIDGHTLRYGVGVGRPVPIGAGYLLATVGALLASGQRDIRAVGVACGVGAVVCLLLWQTAFVSTWCALAAVASLLVLRWVRRSRTADRRVPLAAQ